MDRNFFAKTLIEREKGLNTPEDSARIQKQFELDFVNAIESNKYFLWCTEKTYKMHFQKRGNKFLESYPESNIGDFILYELDNLRLPNLEFVPDTTRIWNSIKFGVNNRSSMLKLMLESELVEYGELKKSTMDVVGDFYEYGLIDDIRNKFEVGVSNIKIAQVIARLTGHKSKSIEIYLGALNTGYKDPIAIEEKNKDRIDFGRRVGMKKYQ